MAVSLLEEELENQLLTAKETAYVREYRFHPVRRWRFDFAWVVERIAVEVDGGTFNFGRHNRPTGFSKDCEKYNAAVLDGWRVLRFDGAMVKDGTALTVIQQALRTLV